MIPETELSDLQRMHSEQVRTIDLYHAKEESWRKERQKLMAEIDRLTVLVNAENNLIALKDKMIEIVEGFPHGTI